MLHHHNNHYGLVQGRITDKERKKGHAPDGIQTNQLVNWRNVLNRFAGP